MKFTLRQLQVFCAIAHHQNVSRAAQELAMSQSACSGALKELEQQYSTQLFDRAGKKLKINQLGSTLRPKAEALLGAAEQFEEDISQHKAAFHLTIGSTLTIGDALAGPLVQAFSEQHSDARIRLEVANTETIAKNLSNFHFDIGLIEGELNHKELDVLPWREDELVCFCAPDHPLAKRRHLKDHELKQAKWILREPGSGTRQTFDRAMQGIAHTLDISLELQHTEAIKQAVASGLGLSCLSRLSLKKEFEQKTLVALDMGQRSFKRMFSIVLHKDKYRTAGIVQWLKLCEIAG